VQGIESWAGHTDGFATNVVTSLLRMPENGHELLKNVKSIIRSLILKLHIETKFSTAVITVLKWVSKRPVFLLSSYHTTTVTEPCCDCVGFPLVSSSPQENDRS
jgi:hypothetical protein